MKPNILALRKDLKANISFSSLLKSILTNSSYSICKATRSELMCTLPLRQKLKRYVWECLADLSFYYILFFLKIGTAVIPLLKLIEQNKSADVSAVVKGDAVIQGRSDPSSRQEYHIGTIDYIMRMRYPIAAKVKQLSTLLGRNELSKFDDD
jgi:hypothetical protein